MKVRGKVLAFMAIALIGGVGLIVYGCGSEPVDLNVKQDNNAPNGSVQGWVRDANTRELLANVEIKVQVKGGWVSTRSNGQGRYSLSLPANNSYEMYASLTGYAIGIVGVNIPATWQAGGLYPVYTNEIVLQDIDLYPSDATLEVIVLRKESCGTQCSGGTAASPVSQTNASVVVDLISSNFEYAETQSLGGSSTGTWDGIPAPIIVPSNNIVSGLPIDCGGAMLTTFTTAVTASGGTGNVAFYNGVTSRVWLVYAGCITIQ